MTKEAKEIARHIRNQFTKNVPTLVICGAVLFLNAYTMYHCYFSGYSQALIEVMEGGVEVMEG